MVPPYTLAISEVMQPGVLKQLLNYQYGFFMLINGYEGEIAVYGQFAALLIHLFDVNFDMYPHACIAYVYHPTDQFYKSTGGDGLFKVYPIAANGYHYLAAKAGCSNKGYLIHHMHGGAAKQGIVMVGGVGEYGFKYPGF